MFVRPTMTKKFIGGYFLDVKANGGRPLKLRTDYGTEKGHDSSKAVVTSFVDLCLTSVCYAFVRICF